MKASLEQTWVRFHFANVLLAPLAGLYALGWISYLAVYQLGFKSPAKPKVPTICIGNLLVGGAGKSPMTRYCAGLLAKMGYKVVVGCSGYGSPRQHEATLAPPGELDPEEWGDEPAMFRWLMPDIPLVVGRDRVLAAELVADAYPGCILLMDDGYQHLRLEPQVRILLDPESPINLLCLPAGPYREPRSLGRKRADLILPRDFLVTITPLPLRNEQGEIVEVSGQVNVLCALGRPYLFLESVEDRGLTPKVVRFYPDHDPLTAGNLWKEFEPEIPLVTTAKDWVKLRRRQDRKDRTLLIADIEVRIENEVDFQAWLKKKLHESQR